MKTQMYVIYDEDAQESGPIFEAKNDAIALRLFKNILIKNNIGSNRLIMKHVGEIDHETDKINTKHQREIKITLGVEDEQPL